MTNIMLINFFLRKSHTNPATAAVYVEVTINSQRVQLGAVTSVSGLKLPKSIMIEVRHWDKKEERVKRVSDQALAINKAIDACREKLTRIYNQHEGFEVYMNGKDLKNMFFDQIRLKATFPLLMDAFIKEREAIGSKASTINTYKYKFIPILEFLTEKGMLRAPVDHFTPAVLNQFRVFMITRRANKARSADKICQVVKTVLLWAAGNGTIAKNPLINIRIRVDKTPNVERLDQEEVAKLISANLPANLRAIADCFIFSCYTGLAYDDLRLLSSDNLQVVQSHRCLVGKRKKTGTDYCIPITPVVSGLIEKYGGVSLPLPTNQAYNRALKLIMFRLDIAKNVSSHTARKTFCDWCMNELGMTNEATTVAMGQKAAKELDAYRKMRPKRMLREFPDELLMQA